MAGKKKTTETEAVKAAETMAAAEEVGREARRRKRSGSAEEEGCKKDFCRQKNHSGKENCCS